MSISELIPLVVLVVVAALVVAMLARRARTLRAMRAAQKMAVGPRAYDGFPDQGAARAITDPGEDAESVYTSRPGTLTENIAAEIPLRVLLAEDTSVNQTLITRIFARMGYEITVVDNGRAAVECARGAHFDLILMDIQMPEMDGIEACRHILAEARARALAPPIIVAVTANASPDNRRLCLDAGMADFIAKPFTLEQLQRLVTDMSQRAA